MTKPWRPEGWQNPYEVISHSHIHEDGKGVLTLSGVHGEPYNAFEDGADALLEALFKLAKESPTKTFTIDSLVITN